MTLSSHLLSQHLAMQTPHSNGVGNNNNPQAYSPYTPMSAGDGSQFGAHHGMSPWGMSPGMPMTPAMPGRFSQWSEERVATMQARLSRKLGPEYVTQRPGPGGGPKLSYIEGWKVVNLANDVFGFNGWSSSIVRLHTDFLDVNAQDRVSVGISSTVRITLQDGCFHEDVGYGHAENIRGKAAALEKAQKEAVTDGIKRALKSFGNVLGNCLYDREYTKDVQKIKVPPAKFNVEELERRPEFTPQGATRPASAVPRTVSGEMKPPPPPRAESTRQEPEEALRSVDEFDDLALDDSEFAFMESESFLVGFDESVLSSRVSGETPMLGQSAPAQQPAAQPTTYTHRQRPDLPPLTTYTHRQRPDMPPALDQENVTARSVSGSSSNHSEPRSVGGFASGPGAQSAEAAAAARRRAILGLTSAPPPRGESPRLPSGGIDAVAARAAANLSEHGVNLEIDNSEMAPGKYGAFTSARGVKRDGSSSPTKYDRLRPGGPRTALSEIPLVDPEDPTFGPKRSRVM